MGGQSIAGESFRELDVSAGIADPVALAVSPSLEFVVTPESASKSVLAYADHLAQDIFAHASSAPLPPVYLASANIRVRIPTCPCSLASMRYAEVWVASDPCPCLPALHADSHTPSASLRMDPLPPSIANTTYGAFMGLQTLGQAIRFDFDSELYGVAAVPLSIADAPKFAWRGILVDSDRHWLRAKRASSSHRCPGLRKAQRAALAHCRLGFSESLESPSFASVVIFPRKHLRNADCCSGRWKALHFRRSGQLHGANVSDTRSRTSLQSSRTPTPVVSALCLNLTREQMTLMNVFARITTSMLCSPGHASSICHAYPDRCCTPTGCGWGPNSPLTPVPDAEGRNVSLDTIQAVLGEIAAVSPDECLHLGGDGAFTSRSPTRPSA